MAEREGFEPSMRFRIHAFQACAFNRSATSPKFFADYLPSLASRRRLRWTPARPSVAGRSPGEDTLSVFATAPAHPLGHLSKRNSTPSRARTRRARVNQRRGIRNGFALIFRS